MSDDHPISEAQVRSALATLESRGLRIAADTSTVLVEDRWVGVSLPERALSLEQTADLHTRLIKEFPAAEIEIQVGGFIYRGSSGKGLGRDVIAVLGGKGGVGKSTVSANLAITLSAMGVRTGLIDADLAAPDIPHMLGIRAFPTSRAQHWNLSVGLLPPSKRTLPNERYGLEVASSGFASPEGAPIYVSGQMVSALIRHLLFGVTWTADLLLIDTPPGIETAIQVLARDVPLSGAILVTTPQDLAQMDTERTLNLLRENKVPVIGIVQNMASLVCPHCHQELGLFSSSSRLTDQGVRVLQEIPFDTQLAVNADRGDPLVLSDPTGPMALAFARLAFAVRSWLQAQTVDESSLHR